MFLLTSVPAIRAIETGMKMREPMRLRKPMMRVPVFREMQAQQFASFGRETILGRKISENEPGQSWQPRLWVEILIWFEWKYYRLWRGSVLPVTNVSIYLYIEETLKCWSLEETLWTVHPGVSLLNYNTSCSDVKRNQAAREIRRAPAQERTSFYQQKPFFAMLKGSFTIFLFSVRTHILNSNGVWYSWFWPEGPKNAQNSIFLDFKFVPRDLDSQRHMGPRLAAQGTLTRGAGDLDSRRHGKLSFGRF